MIEYRSFEGDSTELSRFVVNTWRATYEGKMAVPDWNPEYLTWQLHLDEPRSSRGLVAAYDNQNVVGSVLFFRSEFELHGQRYSGAQASWLSVDPDYRGQGIAKGLFRTLRERLKEDQLDFELGFAFEGSRQSLGPKFWKSKDRIQQTQLAGRVGFWTRLLDPLRVADWNLNKGEAFFTRLFAKAVPVPKLRERGGMAIRPFQTTDTQRVLELAEQATSHCDLRIIWDADRIKRHASSYGQCLIAETTCDAGHPQVQGCIMFHLLPIYGRTREPVGIVDALFVSELSLRQQSEFLDAVLFRMREQGAVVAIKLRGGDYPLLPFLKYGWIWRPADSHVLLHWSDESSRREPIRTKHILWR